MQISEGHLAAWQATAAALETIEPSELDLLPDIAASVHEKPPSIRSVPGAFGFEAAQVQSAAVLVYGLVVDCMARFGPKLFDAVVDVGKEGVKEVVKDRLKRPPPAPPVAAGATVDPAQLKDWIRTAALERKLSAANADVIANAVLAQLVLAGGHR